MLLRVSASILHTAPIMRTITDGNHNPVQHQPLSHHPPPKTTIPGALSLSLPLTPMAPLKILICGGGIAGPALAFWLSRAGHRVVVVERHPVLRASGAQVDLRAQGIAVVDRMGLLGEVRRRRVDEAGVCYVDDRGAVWGTLLANTSGKGAQMPTSEYEIMRGDLVRLLHDATKDDVEYVFGKTVESFVHDDEGVVAHFSDGSSDSYDMLVGADGQGSRVRKAILPADAPDPYHHLGIYAAYYFVPRADGDSNVRVTYHSPGGRMIMRRTHSPTESQVYLMLKDDSAELASLPRASPDAQKEFWARRFRGAGWQTERFLAGMDGAENFYCQEAAQVKIDSWSQGRVVLLGDAAHCPSPFAGMGTSGAFIGAYVLAGEIARSPDDLPRAFARYEAALRPFVDEMQSLKLSLIRLAMPVTQWGINVLHYISWLMCMLPIPQIAAMFSSEEKGGWKLPDYPELRANR